MLCKTMENNKAIVKRSILAQRTTVLAQRAKTILAQRAKHLRVFEQRHWEASAPPGTADTFKHV